MTRERLAKFARFCESELGVAPETLVEAGFAPLLPEMRKGTNLRSSVVRIVAMISSRFSHGRDPYVSVEAAARQWRELYNVIEEIKDTSHAGSHFLSFYRDQMVSSADRLLELGLDVSDLHNPRVVPVPIARHPKTEAETRRWDAEISFRIEEHMLSFSVAGVGAHVVYSAVGDAPLVEVLAGYVHDASTLPRENIAALISMSNLEYLALACSHCGCWNRRER
jgi:hypothetical protein